jgi:death-on-curing protein
MPTFFYPTVAEAIEMHRQLIHEFGGIQGLRDRGLLEAAIFRPQSGYYDDLVHEAAALMESLASNHPFIDGNKRASFAITDTFLRLDGYYIEVEAPSAHKFITESIERRQLRIGPIRSWLSVNVRRLEDN